ncbi:MAG: Stk1 family PASTA domain-containing Ser/Thr kinase [Oscillospiraceae bacterium]|nr:Stk1 family PASTA domain-containing Ser/Thr kinase [Oscillospiraceae bacterium]
MMDNYIGRLLDNRYEILEVIGTGGMAVVYKARCHRLKRLVAIKILKDEYSQDEEFRRRFKAESQAVAMLSHPNIVSIYDVNSSDGIDYIVMELIDGITLKQYMERRGQLNWRETLHFSIQIAKALEHAHSRGIIHRDIKPHNIMILKDGSVKVADFGIARMTSAQNTLTREALGSVHYISPEQAKGGKVDCRSDLYALGVVMYEMMTGKTPFDGDTPVAVAIQHINGTAQLPRELNPDVPLGLEQITMHAMTADLPGRYASASDMLNDLEEFRKNPSMVFHFAAPANRTAQAGAVVAGAAGGAVVAGTSAAPQQTPRRAQEQPGAPRPKRPNLAEVYGEGGAEGKKEKKTSKRTIVLVSIAAVLVVAAVGYLLFGVLLKNLLGGSGTVKVPSFVGKSYEDIYPAQYPDFSFEVKEWVYDDTLDYGYIITQSPDADTEAETGTTIYLTISMGVETRTMPPLTNLSVDDATKLLDDMDMGLLVVLNNVYNSDVAKGYVISSDPVAGVALEDNQTVTLNVSLGAAETEQTTAALISVPKVEGKQLNDAISALQAIKLGVGTIKEVESEKESGTVINQSIAEGQKVEEGTKINLEVSKGEETTTETTTAETTKQETTTTQPETTTAAKTGTWSGSIDLTKYQGTGQTTTVSLLLDGNLVATEPDVEVSAGTIPVTLEGSGTHNLDVYFGGDYAYSQQVTFK